MMIKVLILIGAITLSGCSLATDVVKGFLSDDKGGIHADAQVGSNDQKVDTGVGRIGSEHKTEQTIEDNQGEVNVRNSDGKFHIESDEEINIIVEETNDMVYYLMGFFFLLTIIREFFSWRKKGDDS